MQNKIHLLPQDLINKIAAGEVIERPASILKELLENSIDAEADDIQISLDKSGLERITISDNGTGLSSEEVVLAFTQHATSKINSQNDLNKITTLGFRGEALSSISSISSVTVQSYNGIDRPVLYQIEDTGNEILIGQGRNRGTTIIIQNIFSKMPVRRKFLKSETTEYKYFLDYFISIAIGNPTVKFDLTKNNRLIYSLKKTSSFSERIFQIFNTIKGNDFFPVDYKNGNFQISGLIGQPQIARNINNYQYIFLNGRFIKNPLIHKAIKEGFATAIMKNLEPPYFLFFTINPDEVDVNVHPRKLEVRFNNPGFIYSTTKNQIIKTIEKGLQNNISIFSNKDKNTNFINKGFKNKSASINFTKNILHDTQQIESALSSSELIRSSKNALQVFDTYLIFEKGEKILIIDQHAMHERINFEKIVDQFEKEQNLTAQGLLIPLNIKVNDLTKEQIFSNDKFLRQIGFEFNIIGNSLVINQIPNLLPINRISEIFLKILSELELTEGEGGLNWTDIKNKVLATIACHISIRAGQKLEPYIISQLVSDLIKCKLPYSCPHGRPFFWEISKEEMERNFKR